MDTSETCVLCLDADGSIMKEYTEVYSEKGIQLKISNIVNKHFPLFLTKNNGCKAKICSRCWKTVSDFHSLHEFVTATQSSLQETKVLPMEDDPLTQGNSSETVKLCAEETQDHDQEQSSANERDFFCAEIKIEEHELDHLPKIEIIESTGNVALPTVNTDARRLRKRVKAEAEITLKLASKDDLDTDTSVKPKKGRGRPRKTPLVVETARDSQNDKFQDSSMKTELSDDSDDENHDTFTNISDEDAMQSDESSDDSRDSSDETDSEEGPPTAAVYAVIPKRTAVRPKKYKKRPKPVKPRVHMSRELLEQRKKMQEEYDSIIAKFFNSVLPCALCNLVVHNFTEMQRHHRITHLIDAGYVMCCGKKFTQRKVLAEHVQVHWNPEHFKCPTCTKSFQNSRHLESHQQVHVDPIIKLTFHCDQCPKVFLSKTAIDYHKLNKHVPKSEFKFNCPTCSKRFLTDRKLKNHMSSMHDPENTIICDKCGKQMRTKIILKKHQELMHSDKPRPEAELKQCQICGAWLKGMTGLKQHMKSIHVESAGEHRCHVCTKVSPNARALRRHIYHNHQCERKFKCTMCDKAFKRPQELREHTSTHTGEVLYTCPNCPMTFFCSANMYKHRQRLHRAQYEADKNQPKPPNILQQAVGATAAMKVKLMQHSNTVTPSLSGIEPDLKHF